MSHLAILETKITNLEAVVLACGHLGIGILPAKQVSTWYQQTSSGTSRVHECDLVFGRKHAYYGDGNYAPFAMGLRLVPEKGVYEFIGDNFDAASYDRHTLLQLGPSMLKYEEQRINGLVGHVCTGKPTALLQEYALQVGVQLAIANGMFHSRQPAEAVADDAPEGSEKLVLTGGYLPPHMSMHLIGCPDGTSRVRFEGATDSSCYLYTKPLEEQLGLLLADVSVHDTLHHGQTHFARAAA